MVADRYPQHPLAGASLVWLVQYYASAEAAWRIRQTDRLTAEQVTAVEPARRSRGRQQNEPIESLRGACIGPGAADRNPSGFDRRGRSGRRPRSKPLRWPSGSARSKPPCWPNPASVFRWRSPIAGKDIRGRRNDLSVALARVRTMPGGRRPSASSGCPSAMARPPSRSRPVCESRPSPVWTGGSMTRSGKLRPLELHSARREDASWSAVAMLAYDDEFLYLAASCRQVEAIRRSEIEKKREHDADLSWQDRIEFCLESIAIARRTIACRSISAAARTTRVGTTRRGTPSGS